MVVAIRDFASLNMLRSWLSPTREITIWPARHRYAQAVFEEEFNSSSLGCLTSSSFHAANVQAG